MCWICRVINHVGQLGCCNVKELTETQRQLVRMSECIQVINKDVRVILDCFIVVPSLFLHTGTFFSTSVCISSLSRIHSSSF